MKNPNNSNNQKDDDESIRETKSGRKLEDQQRRGENKTQHGAHHNLARPSGRRPGIGQNAKGVHH